jgi:outer membrane biosynthesis protein TonB
LEPVYVDEKIQGRFPIQVSLVIRPDGTIENVTIEKAPSDSLQHKIEGQIGEWLFEPPTKDGQPVRASTKLSLNVNVVRSK